MLSHHSGSSLHKRGYRTEAGEAPLKENLAAALLIRAGWLATAADGGSLVDPLCGSGTLVIEGAPLAGDVAPGLLRGYFGFLGWKGHDPKLWRTLVEEAEERRHQNLRRLPPMVGFDSDPKAIARAQANASRAGLKEQTRFLVQDVFSLERTLTTTPRLWELAVNPQDADSGQAPLPRGLVITNPPYGHRLSEDVDLAALYETLGEKLKAVFPGCKAAIVADNSDLTDFLGLRAHRVNTFYNGPLPCRLLRELAEGKRFLNLFSYTGSATVCAAAGGALKTGARRGEAYRPTRKLDSSPRGLGGSQGSYDLIFLDPPTFSNSKRSARDPEIQRDHTELIRAAGRLLSLGGILIFSTNYRWFRLDASIEREFTVADLTRRTIPPDFARNPRIHHRFRLTLRPEPLEPA